MFQTTNLYQNDPLWKETPLGNQARETIGSWGCLMTSMTMVVNGLGYNETPATMNEKLKKNGGFQDALVIPAVLPLLFPTVVYRGFDPCENSPAPIDRIDAALAAGKPVIVQVDWNPAEGIQTHWIVLKERKGDDYVMYDPYRYRGDSPEKELLMTERYKHQGRDPSGAISGVLWLDGAAAPAKPPAKAKTPVPANPAIAFAIEDDLALRGDPAFGGYLIKRLLAGAQLTCLEPKNTVQSKLGQTGQWLHVQEPQGEQGYVAAWYCGATYPPPPAPAAATPPAAPATTPAPTPPAAPATTPAPTPPATPAAPKPPSSGKDMVLQPTTDNIAMRTKPVIAPETQIKRLPVSEKLVVIEPPAQAMPKIGVQGQWTQVRDSSGQEGFVAAWYVQVVSVPSTAAPAAAPVTPPGAALRVRTSVEGVALRSQPLVADSTLIRRMALGTELTVTDPAGASKIGVADQWLKVCDPLGTEGFVAAWFVSR